MKTIFAGRRAALIFSAALIVGSPLAARSTDLEGRLFPARALAAHNLARAQAGVPPLQWDRQLGTEAARYALRLAISGTFQHSAPAFRRNAGENLWMGTRGAFSVETMVGNWVSERRLFRAGVFPVVSRTGNWRDVGHYTQIVWPSTQRVGCALATNARNDYLVCHYWPAGNVHGLPMVNSAKLASRR